MKSEFSSSYLDKLIELYFDGLTSLEQEAELRRMLQHPSATGQKAEEARAVMSFAALSPTTTPSTRHTRLISSSFSRVAAIIAVTVTVGTALILTRTVTDTNPQQRYIAYVDGVRIDNEDRVIQLIDADLAVIGEATEDVTDDITKELNAISDILYNDPDNNI